ncbi:MAG: hypothetical protein KDD37_04850 [Bdellovibrionales bacterium]|nr:hypothetical protein [Bdellovibrionales bacterium]
MKEQVQITPASNLENALKKIRDNLAAEIKSNGYSKKAALQLALSELIKEQVKK